MKKKQIYVNIEIDKIVEKSPAKQVYINVTCKPNKICQMAKENEMNQKEWDFKKIYRYKERKAAIENLKVNFKILLGGNHESPEEMKERHNRQMARETLTYLIWNLMFEQNPYEAKQEVKGQKVILQQLEYYGININMVTKEDIDILVKIMKKI